MQRARFERRPTPGPSFNHGWRLGVVIGAGVLLVAIAAILLLTAGRVWDEY